MLAVFKMSRAFASEHGRSGGRLDISAGWGGSHDSGGNLRAKAYRNLNLGHLTCQSLTKGSGSESKGRCRSPLEVRRAERPQIVRGKDSVIPVLSFRCLHACSIIKDH